MAGEAAAVAEEASIATEISGTAGIVTESIESVAGTEIEGVVADVEGTEVRTAGIVTEPKFWREKGRYLTQF